MCHHTSEWKGQLGAKVPVALTVIVERHQDTSLFPPRDGGSHIFVQGVFPSGVLERV